MRRRELISAAAVPVALGGCLRLESNTGQGDDGGAGGRGSNDTGDQSGSGEQNSTDESQGGDESGSEDGTANGDGSESDEGSETDGESEEGSEDDLPDVAIRHERSLPSSTSDDRFVSAVPVVEASPSMPVDGETAFVIENDDTGDSVTVSVTDDRSVEVDRVSLFVYGPEGFLESRNASISASTVDSGFVDLDVSVDGDGTTFTERVRASYRVAYEVGGQRVAETGLTVIPVGHRKEFEYTVGEDVVEYGFNAGELPTDGGLEARMYDQTDQEQVSGAEARYDEEAHRFVATRDAEGIDAGEYSASIEVYNPDGYVEIDLFETLTVE